MGHVCIQWISGATHGARSFRRSEGSAGTAVKKTACGSCTRVQGGWYDRRTRWVRDLPCGDTRVYLEFEVRRILCRNCRKVKREQLAFLADNPFYTKRFAYHVGRRCRTATIKDVAKELKLDWHTVKELDKQYIKAQLSHAGKPKPKVIGIDEVSIRKSHTYRIVGKDRRFIKGQRYTLLSRWDNLTLKGRQALKTLFNANKRLNTAYLLKESFGQLWSYEREGWARRFFENWKAALKWQRLRPYEKFAQMIENHWNGIAAYSRSENKVSLGFVEGLNNKIRVIQRRAYGLRDEEYLRLKILTTMLPEL